jgi:uncharacterized membrane protein YgcG
VRRLLRAVVVGLVTGLAVLAAGSAAAAATQGGGGEVIRSYRAVVDVDATGALHVTETIDYVFAGNQHHGIDRNLVTRLAIDRSDDKVRVYPVSDVTASSPTGAPDDVDVSDLGGTTRIRIGDPERTVRGTQTYVIRYTVEGAFNRFTEPQTATDEATTSPHDELYWNITGDEWTVPIQSAQVAVTAPQRASSVRCFRGVRGSTDTCDATPGATSTFSARGLAPGQGMSILLAYPLHTVSDVAPIVEDAPRSGLARLTQVSPVSIGAAALLFLGIGGAMAALVRRRGRDAVYAGLTTGLTPVSGQQEAQALVTRHSRDVAVQFTPPAGLRPGEIGTLIDEVANPVDVTATIIDLAVRGFLRIEEITNDKGTKVKDWRLVVVLPAPEDDLLPYELELLQALFKGRNEVELKGELRNTFASDLHATQRALYREVTERGWFRGNPDTVRGRYRGLGLGLLVLGFAAVWLGGLSNVNLLVPAAAVFLSGLVVLRLASRMPARTADGSAVLTQARGFQRYLETAEAGQIRFEEGQDVFSRYLPYAIIFGVAERWAGIFDELARQGRTVSQPGWYVGHTPTWSYLALGNSMSSFQTTASSSLVATPASSGSSGFSGRGGFSGGGGGGGGGGSW